MSSASLILTDRSLALSEPKAVGAQGSTKVLAASSLSSCLMFVSSAVVTVALAAIGRDMRLSPLDLQCVMNAELLWLAARTLVAGALGDRFGQRRIFLAGIAFLGLSAAAIGFAPLIFGRFLQGLGEAFDPAQRPFRARAGLSRPWGRHLVRRHGCRQRRRALDRRRDPRSRVLADDLSDAHARSRRRAGRRHRVDTQGLPDQPRPGRRRWRCLFDSRARRAGRGADQPDSGLNLCVLVTLIVGLGGLACLIVIERRLGDNAMLPPSHFASRSVVGANPFTALLYGPFTVMLTLIPFAMIRGAHLQTPVAGLAFIPLQVLITVVSRLAACSADSSAGACHCSPAAAPWDAPSRSVSVRTQPIGRRSSPRPVAVAGHLAVLIIEPGPTSTSSRETEPFGVRNRQAGKAGRNNEERRPTSTTGENP